MTIAAVACIARTFRSSSLVRPNPIGGVGDSPFGPVPMLLFDGTAP